MDSKELKDHLNRILPIKPYIYVRNIKNETQYQKLMTSNDISQPDYKSIFTTKIFTNNGVNMKFIYKNGAQNASIF
jgi:hypothetical protein